MFRLIPNSARNSKPAPVSARERAVAGRIDYRNASSLRRVLFEALPASERLVAVDCSRVSFMDGAAVATVLEFSIACRRKGVRLALVRPSVHVNDAFALYGLKSLLRDLAWNEDASDESLEELGGLLIVLDDEMAARMDAPRLAG